MHRKIAFSLLFLPLFFAAPVHAAEPEKPGKTPAPAGAAPAAVDQNEADQAPPAGPIVITARRLDAARTRIDQGLGATVYSLTNETIENRPGGETGSIAAILGQVPGVGLSSSALTIRGSRAIQVRINDVILPEAISDPADQLSSRLAETTNLITGTLPAQFGFAPGGVISVTTKNGLYQKGGQAEIFAGSRGMLEPAIEWSGSVAGTSLFATGSLERSRSRVADVFGNAARDRRHEVEGLAFADHLLGPHDRVSLIVGGARERHIIGATSLPAGFSQSEDGYAVAAFQHSAGELSVQAALSVAGASDRARFVADSRERRGSTGAQIDATYALGQNRIGAGLLLNGTRVHETDQAARRRTTLGLYAQDEWTVTPGVTLNAGLRADWLRRVGGAAEIEPRASIVWEAPLGFTAHAGYARFAAAAPLEQEGAAPLPIERDDYFGAGVQRKAGPWTFGVDGYWRAARNFIAEHKVVDAATSTAFSFARARLRGIELSTTYAHGRITGWANVSVSKSEARDIVAGGQIFSPETLSAAANGWLPLASDRPIVASGGLTWRIGKFSLSGDVTAASGTVRTSSPDRPNGGRSGPVATFGLAGVYHVRIAGRPADLRMDLTNLTNVHYLSSDGANLEGGWTRFGDGRAILVGIEQGF